MFGEFSLLTSPYAIGLRNKPTASTRVKSISKAYSDMMALDRPEGDRKPKPKCTLGSRNEEYTAN